MARMARPEHHRPSNRRAQRKGNDMSDEKKAGHQNVYTALTAAQADMGRVVKGSVNPHYKNRYADLADVMQVALPALTEHGICAWHSTVHIDGTLHMRTTLTHGETDTHMHCDIPLLTAKHDMQAMKSATTYAKRIGIESLTGIAPDDDDGNAAAKGTPPATITQEQQDDLVALMEEVGADREKFLAYLGCPGGVSHLPADKFPAAVKALEAKRRAS